MKLPDGTYWLSLHGDDKTEVTYAGYQRVQARFIDGLNASATTFDKCEDDDRHAIAYVGLSYTREGAPFEIVALTCSLTVGNSVRPNAAARMLGVAHDGVGA